MIKEEYPQTNFTKFSSEVLGVLWFSKFELSKDLHYFQDLNYLTDKLLSQYLFQDEKQEGKRSNLFFTKNFNHPFFVSHIATDQLMPTQILSEIDEQIAIIIGMKSQLKKIIVMDENQKSWSSELKKLYPQFEFTDFVNS